MGTDNPEYKAIMDKLNAERAFHKRVVDKLDIVSDYEGCELGDFAGQMRELLDGSTLSYGFEDDKIQKIYEWAEEAADGYIQWLVDEVASEMHYNDGKVSGSDFYYDLVNVNKDLEKAGLAPMWPEGFTPPTAEDLEAQGSCVDHPYESYYSSPRGSCERCWRIYFQKHPDKLAEKEKTKT